MTIDPGAVGTNAPPVERRWGSTDCILYALGVGAGPDELAFTTENSLEVDQAVLPTMGVVLGPVSGAIFKRLGGFDPSAVLHGEQAITLAGPIPVEGRLEAETRVVGIYDKQSAALVMLETTSVDAETGRLLFTTRSALFIRGAGGWGGERGPSAQRLSPPPRPPDHVVSYRTRVDQALLYRLSADRNPFHSDPAVARKAGFERPILQGLCTYGFTGRALLHMLCAGDPSRFGSMEARFSAPVFPGDELQVRIWAEDSGAVFQTARSDGEIVIDGGRFTFSGLSA